MKLRKEYDVDMENSKLSDDDTTCLTTKDVNLSHGDKTSLHVLDVAEEEDGSMTNLHTTCTEPTPLGQLDSSDSNENEAGLCDSSRQTVEILPYLMDYRQGESSNHTCDKNQVGEMSVVHSRNSEEVSSRDNDTAVQNHKGKQPDGEITVACRVMELIEEFNMKMSQVRRVKFYEADTECGQWEERGIGVVHLSQVPLSTDTDRDVQGVNRAIPEVSSAYQDICISVTDAQNSDSTSSVNSLLETTILSNANYCLQNRRLITWMGSLRLRCLSFVKQSSCSTFWTLLQLVAPDRIGDEEDEEDSHQPEEYIGQSEKSSPCGLLDFQSSPTDSVERQPERQQEYGAVCTTLDLSTTDTEGKDSPESNDGTHKDEISKTYDMALHTPPGDSFRLLDQYDDAVLHHSIEARNPHTTCNNAMFSPLPFPHTSEALSDCLSDIHILERNVTSYPCEVFQALSNITETPWLSALWDLLSRAISAADETLCSSIAEFLWRVVYIYFHRSNSFFSLAVNPECDRFLESWDPLVRLLSDTHYKHFFCAMEYETELRKHWLKVEHVEFLEKASNFKQIICRGDETFRTTSHFIYRLIYLRDVCLPRHLDDQTLQRVNSIINAGYAYLCRVIQMTPNSIAELRELILEDPAAARFLHQLLCIFRSSNDVPFSLEKYRIFGALRSECVIEALEMYLVGNCKAVHVWRRDAKIEQQNQQEELECMETLIANDVEHRYRHHILSHGRPTILTPAEIAIEILYLVVECRPGIVRSAFLRQASELVDERPTFWFALCDVFHKTDNEGLQIQVAEMFKKLLDPVLMESPERDDFLGLFYDKGVLDRLIHILLTPTPVTFTDLIPIESHNHDTQHHRPPLYPYFLHDFWNEYALEESHQDDLEKEEENPKDDNCQQPKIGAGVSNSVSCVSANHSSGDSLTTNPSQSYLKRCQTTFYDYETHKWKSVTQPVTVSADPSVNASSTAYNSYNYANYAHYRDPNRIRKYLLSLNRQEQDQVLLTARTQLSLLKCRITEILSFCVVKHSSRIKYRNFQQNLHLHIIKMSYEPTLDPFLAVCGVKFLRACLAAEPEHYARIFIRHNIFRPILFLLKSSLSVNVPCSRGEGSLLESVVLEFFNFLSTSVHSRPAIASLVKSLFQRYSQDCNDLAQFYRDVCQFELFYILRTQYEELQASDKRSTRNDVLESPSCFPNSYFNGSAVHGKARTLPHYGYKLSPNNKLSSEEVEREMEDLYFQLDDDVNDSYTSPCKITYWDDNNRLPLKGTASSSVPSETITTTSLSKHHLEVSLLPHFSHDDDEDDSDVPTFLKSSSLSTTSRTVALPNLVQGSNKTSAINLKIHLQSSEPCHDDATKLV